MEPFGPFEVIREIDAIGGATVYRARKEGDRKGEYIVKVFSLERLVAEEPEETKSELDPLFRDIGGSFTNRTNLQKKAAETSPNFAPILAAGHDERGAWYATNFYARSIQGMLERLVALESRDLLHIVQSVVKATLHLKKISGRSHGNLKPSNVFIAGTARPRNSRVVISDPVPGGEREAGTFERADLRSIGELIYQLVLRRKVDFSSGWVILPVETSREWTELFGKKTQDWLDLCNRLLDPKLSLDRYTLERLAADLPRLKPKRPLALTVAPIAAVVLLGAGIAAYLSWRAGHYGTLVVTTNPPGASVQIIPLNDYGAEEPKGARTKTTPTSPADNPRPLKVSLTQGQYRLVAEYQADNGVLKSRGVRVSVEPRHVTTTNLYLPHGALVVLSDPPEATISVGPNARRTPYTNLFLKPGEVAVELKLANYLPRSAKRVVPTNGVAMIRESLERIQAGRVNVTFASDPPGATLRLDDGESHPAPWVTGLEDGRQYTLVAELPGWDPQTRRVQFALRDGGTRTNESIFQYGILQIGETEPAGAEIVLDGKTVGDAPRDIAVTLIEHSLSLRADGYSNYTAVVSIAGHKQKFPVSGVKLQAIGGLIRFLIDPPLANVEITERLSGKLVVATTPDELEPVRTLPPTNYDLTASHPYFGKAQAKVSSVAGRTNRAVFEFPFGATVFADLRPDDVRAVAEISRTTPPADPAVKVGELLYQKPDEVAVYMVKAPGYQTRNFTNAVAARKTNRIDVALSRVTVPVRLETIPPGLELYNNGVRLDTAGQELSLPWGPAEFVARHARLGAITNRIDLKWNAPNEVPPFKFDYSTLMLTNLPGDVTVRDKEGNEELPVQPGAIRMAYERPGPHTYELFVGNQRVDTVTTNLPSGASITLLSEIAARERLNSVGMRFVRVRELFGPNKDGWVGKCEVTQAEFEKVMGAGANSSRFKDPDLPVVNVSWAQATEFCQRLSRMDSTRPFGPVGQYQLPDFELWKRFASSAFASGVGVSHAVIGATQPAKVGSKGSDAFGLNDVLGNVVEWLEGGSGANRPTIGGGYKSSLGFRGASGFLEKARTPEELDSRTAFEEVGFRVVWVPGQ